MRKSMLGVALSTLMLGVSAQRRNSEEVEECEWRFYARSDKVKGPVIQIPDGQIQIHNGKSAKGAARFWIDEGHMYDDAARGCIQTQPQKQIQCDYGNDGDDGFAVKGGLLALWGDATLWACPINDHGEWNLYTDPLPGQLKCHAVSVYAFGNKYCTGDTKTPDWDDDDDDDTTITHHHTATQTTTATVTQDCNKCGSNKPCYQTCTRPTRPPKPPKPTSKPCGGHCWPPTTTSTTTSLVTVTKQKPIPCKQCGGQSGCMKTCTVIATATATTTVWKPCQDKCKGDFECFKGCKQPKPTCGPGVDCSSWKGSGGSGGWGGDSLPGEDWGWKPRPPGYSGYWPYDPFYKGKPEGYGGYWKGDIPKYCGDWDGVVDGPSKSFNSSHSFNSSNIPGIPSVPGKGWKRQDVAQEADADSSDSDDDTPKLTKRQQAQDTDSDSDDEQPKIARRQDVPEPDSDTDDDDDDVVPKAVVPKAGAIDEALVNAARNKQWLETARNRYDACSFSCYHGYEPNPGACLRACAQEQCNGICHRSSCCDAKCAMLLHVARSE